MPESVIQIHDIDAAEKWQQILADLLTDPKELLKILQLDPSAISIDPQVLAEFPLKVPRPYLERIEKGQPVYEVNGTWPWQEDFFPKVNDVKEALEATKEAAA